MPPDADEDLADRVLAARDGRRQIPPLSEAAPLSLARAYAVARGVARRREARGARAVGRKIGFTNRVMWSEYGVSAPIWGDVWDDTLRPLGEAPVDPSDLLEPRIEPEIALRLSARPGPGMSDAALMGCVAAVAPAFELVQSLYPGWRFTAADTVAALGLHGALLHGPFVPVAPGSREAWADLLRGFSVTLSCNGAVRAAGQAEDVMGGGPLAALRHLAGLIAADPTARPLEAGEVVTTGTLTPALPIAPGERWQACFGALPVAEIALSLA